VEPSADEPLVFMGNSLLSVSIGKTALLGCWRWGVQRDGPLSE
jgi:hypothetical protein